jgi:hypothetical protein
VKIFLAILVIGALLFVADTAARGVAEGRAASYLQEELGLEDEPEVSFGGTPFILKAMGGSLPSVEVEAEDIVSRGLRLHDVSLQFDSVKASFGDLLSGSGSVRTDGGTGSASLSAEDLSSYLKKRGAPAEIMIFRGDIAVTTPELGTQIGTPTLENGFLVISPEGSPMPLRIRLPGITGGLEYEKASIDDKIVTLEFSVPAGPLEAPAA